MNILDLAYLVGMEVKDIKFCEALKIFYILDVVLAQHEYSERRYCLQMGDLFNLVVV